MRIAVSGTHFSGKTTLIASLLKHFPSYSFVKEPYLLLEDEGYEFSDPPSLEDFEKQSARLLKEIKQSTKDTFFDRCPLDLLAYAELLAEEPILIDRWIEEIEEAMDQLDLIIFVPIEKKDRIHVPMSEDMDLRKKVDQKIREFLMDDPLGILHDVEILEVYGSLENRVQTIKDHLSAI